MFLSLLIREAPSCHIITDARFMWSIVSFFKSGFSKSINLNRSCCTYLSRRDSFPLHFVAGTYVNFLLAHSFSRWKREIACSSLSLTAFCQLVHKRSSTSTLLSSYAFCSLVRERGSTITKHVEESTQRYCTANAEELRILSHSNSRETASTAIIARTFPSHLVRTCALQFCQSACTKVQTRIYT